MVWFGIIIGFLIATIAYSAVFTALFHGVIETWGEVSGVMNVVSEAAKHRDCAICIVASDGEILDTQAAFLKNY